MITKFGIWEIEEDFGIIGKVTSSYSYKIEKKTLWDTRDYQNQTVWDWLLHLTEKTWMTLDIFNDLVVAYVFAQEYFKKFKPKDTKSASMVQSIFIAQQLIELHENKNNSNDPNDMGLDLGSEESLKIMGEYFDKLSKVRLLKEI